MHLVFLNQYYPPDAAPTGVMLEAVVDELARQGHQVTVICAAGGYAGAAGGGVASDQSAVSRKEKEGEATSNIERPRSNVEVAGMERGIQSLRWQAMRKVAKPSQAGPQAIHSASSHQPSTLNSQHSLPHGMNESRDESHDPCLLAESSNSQLSTLNHQHPPTILRLPASRFGRGTFVGKLLDYASYYFGVAWKLAVLQPRPDRIVALTTPPYLSVLARLISKFRGADHAHWVMDLYPDVMAAHRMLGERSLLYRILKRAARWGFGGRRCAAVLTLGPDMAEKVGEVKGTSNIERPTSNIEGVEAKKESVVGGPLSVVREQEEGDEDIGAPCDSQPPTINHQLSSIEWVPLWGNDCSGASMTIAGSPKGECATVADTPLQVEGDEDIAAPYDSHPSTVNDRPSTASISPSTINSQPSTSSLALRRKRGWKDDELVVMYSGNMGLGHRFGEILEVARGEEEEVGGGQLAVSGEEVMNEGRDESRAPVVGSLSHQRSTLSSQPSPPRGMNEGRDESRAPMVPSGHSDSQSSTLNSQPSPCGMNECRDESRVPVVGSLSHQRSTLSSQPSPPRGMNEGRGESRAPVQPVASFNPQTSTLDYQPSSRIRFVFFGGGKRRREIEAFLRENPGCAVELHDYAPAEELAMHLQSADVHLASLDPAWTGTMVPSKLQGIFAAGRPVIFIGSAESSIGQWVNESAGGWVVEAGDIGGLLAALEAARDPGVRANRGQAAKAFSLRYFDKATNVARVAEILTRQGAIRRVRRL